MVPKPAQVTERKLHLHFSSVNMVVVARTFICYCHRNNIEISHDIHMDDFVMYLRSVQENCSASNRVKAFSAMIEEGYFRKYGKNFIAMTPKLQEVINQLGDDK